MATGCEAETTCRSIAGALVANIVDGAAGIYRTSGPRDGRGTDARARETDNGDAAFNPARALFLPHGDTRDARLFLCDASLVVHEAGVAVPFDWTWHGRLQEKDGGKRMAVRWRGS